MSDTGIQNPANSADIGDGLDPETGLVDPDAETPIEDGDPEGIVDGDGEGGEATPPTLTQKEIDNLTRERDGFKGKADAHDKFEGAIKRLDPEQQREVITILSGTKPPPSQSQQQGAQTEEYDWSDNKKILEEFAQNPTKLLNKANHAWFQANEKKLMKSVEERILGNVNQTVAPMADQTAQIQHERGQKSLVDYAKKTYNVDFDPDNEDDPITQQCVKAIKADDTLQQIADYVPGGAQKILDIVMAKGVQQKATSAQTKLNNAQQAVARPKGKAPASSEPKAYQSVNEIMAEIEKEMPPPKM